MSHDRRQLAYEAIAKHLPSGTVGALECRNKDARIDDYIVSHLVNDSTGAISGKRLRSNQQMLASCSNGTGSIAKRTEEKLQFFIGLFRTGDSLRDFSADQFAVAPPEPQNSHLDGAFAHVQICRNLGIGCLALFTGQQ